MSNWRKRRARQQMVRWLLYMALFCTVLAAAWVLVMPRVVEGLVKNTLKDQGIELRSFRLAGVSPWFARVEHIDAVLHGFELQLDSAEVDYLPWEVVRGRLNTVRINGLELSLDLEALETFPTQSTEPADTADEEPFLLPPLPLRHILIGETGLTLKRGQESIRLPLLIEITSTEQDGLSLTAHGDSLPLLSLSLEANVNREISGEATVAIEIGTDFPLKALAGDLWPTKADGLAFPLPGLEADFLLVLEKGKIRQTASAIALNENALRWSGVLSDDEASGGEPLHTVLADLQGFLKASQPAGAPLQYEVGGSGTLAVQVGDKLLQAGTLGAGFKADGTAWVALPGARYVQTDKMDAHFALNAGTNNFFAPMEASYGINAQFGWLSLAGMRFKPFGVELRGRVDTLEAQLTPLALESLPQFRTYALSVQVKGLPEVAEVTIRGPLFWAPDPKNTTAEIGVQTTLQARVQMDALTAETEYSLENLPEGLQVHAQFANQKTQMQLPIGADAVSLTGGVNAGITLRDEMLFIGLDWALPEAKWLPTGKAELTATEVTGLLELQPQAVGELAALAANPPKTWAAQAGWMRKALRYARAEGTGIEWDEGLRVGAWAMEVEPFNESADKRALVFSTELARWQAYTAERIEAYVESHSTGINGEVNGLFGDYQLPWAATFSLTPDNQGTFAFGVGPVELHDGRVFLGLIDDLSDMELTGNFTLGAKGSFTLGDTGKPLSWAGSAGLVCSNGKLYFSKHKLSVEGVECVVELESLDPLKSKGVRTISFQRMTSGDLQMTDGIVEFSIEATGELVVSKAEFTWLGGRVLVAPFTTSLENPDFTLAVACVGLDLVELSALFPQTNTKAAGLIDGTMGIRFVDGEVELLPGRFELRPGTKGKLVYDKRGWLTAGMAKEGVSYLTMISVESAVENLEVEQLKISISPVPGARMVPITFQIVGQGWGEGLKTVVPIGGLTINAMIDFYELLDMPFLRQIEGMTVH